MFLHNAAGQNIEYQAFISGGSATVRMNDYARILLRSAKKAHEAWFVLAEIVTASPPGLPATQATPNRSGCV